MGRPGLILVLLGLMGGWTGPSTAQADSRAHHALQVALDPASHQLSVTDQITWPSLAGAAPNRFVLNARLRIDQASPPVEEIPLGGTLDPGAATQTPLKRYRVLGDAATLTLSYSGPLHFPLSDPKDQYTRGFRDSAGLIGAEGLFLAGESFWYPRFGEEWVSFSLNAQVPDGWHLISQGQGTSRDGAGVAHWDSPLAMDEIHLVGGPLRRFQASAGPVETLVYLRDEDPALANQYLTATAQYLDLYRNLIGPYPYPKFALVENFWETGYGMPSFTLLGSQVIRFPFILTSSYPHEILHNWLGNWVWVDPDSGNWCEGLTAYLADHLLQEQRGAGADYRRAALQKYRDYVRKGRDFPLAEFRGRFSAASEAVGYGKALMGFHMTRRAIGDDAFRATLRRFAQEFQGRRAGFRDFQRTAEAQSGQSLGWIFDDLIQRAGAPVLELSSGPDRLQRQGDRFLLEGVVRQIQPGPPFTLDVPLLIQTEDGTETHLLRLDQAEKAFVISTGAPPLALALDPYFDLFRRLDPRETPASVGQMFGQPRILAILPAAAPATELEAWLALFQGWRSDSHAIELRMDTALDELPTDRTLWIAGAANRFAKPFLDSLPGVQAGETAVQIDGQRLDLKDHSLALVARPPAHPDQTVGFLAVGPAAAFPGLGRKLPHYGKYSYLAFQGEAPTNLLKGQWRQSDSPLQVDLRAADQRLVQLPALPPEPRPALAELPPARTP